MTFTYTAGGASELNDIRAALGDTNSAAPGSERLEDEEINRLLTLHGSVAAATVAAARALIAKLARRATEKTVGSLTLVYSQRIETLQTLVADMGASASRLAIPYAGGISISDKEIVETDSDRVEPAFSVGMLDSKRAS